MNFFFVSMAVFDLSSWVMPREFGLKRDVPFRVKVTSQSFHDAYDVSTVFYDVFYDQRQQAVVVLAPRLLNLEPWVRALAVSLDGASVRDRVIRRGRKFDQLVFPTAQQPGRLEISMGSWQTSLAVQGSHLQHFEGTRVLCTVNKNNDLSWIGDWVTFHQRHHGANAVLIFDNGSTEYSVDELDASLAKIPGLKCRGVVSVPLPYGPSRGASRGLGRATYLQASLLNLARERFLSSASAVLSIDVDELVLPVDGCSVFDAAQASWLGMVSFPGHWRYASDTEQPRHRDHVWINDQNEACPPKYCYRPDSLLGRSSLGVHGLGWISWRLFPRASVFSFMHCRSISTSWKGLRQNPQVKLRRDVVLEKLFS